MKKRQIRIPKVIPRILKGFLILFELNIPKNTTIIAEVERITNPIHPEELNIKVLSINETNKTINPEGIPEMSVERKTGISEKSSLRKGNIGSIDKRPKNPNISDNTMNTELYAMERVFCCFIFLCPPSYTKY